jgi:hypothetical protein
MPHIRPPLYQSNSSQGSLRGLPNLSTLRYL